METFVQTTNGLSLVEHLANSREPSPMMLFIFLGIFSVILVVLYFSSTRNFSYWKKRGLPHETPKFLYGNIKEALTGQRHIGLIYYDLYKKFSDASYFGVYNLRTPTVVLRDLDLVKAVLVKDCSSFSKNLFMKSMKKDALLEDNPFFHSGDEWKARRAQWSSTLTPGKVKGLYSTMQEKSERMVDYLNNRTKEHPNEPLEARELAVKYLTDVVVSGMLGIQVDTFTDEENVFKRIALVFCSSDFWKNLSNLLLIMTPSVHSYLNIGFLRPWVMEECMIIAKKLITIRKQHGVMKNDFFESFIKDDEVNYTKVAGRVYGFLSEAVETSSGVVSFALYELAANPQIQSKLRRELEDSAPANDGKITFEDIHKIKYLDMVINETMRMYPPVLTLNKICTEEYELPPALSGGKPFKVPVSLPIDISIYSIHHDPQFFLDPDIYDPERFRNKENIPKYAFLPFGEGPRVCIGMQLGMTNAKIAIAAIVRNFDLRVSPKTRPKPLPLDPKMLLAQPVGDLWLTFHKNY